MFLSSIVGISYFVDVILKLFLYYDKFYYFFRDLRGLIIGNAILLIIYICYFILFIIRIYKTKKYQKIIHVIIIFIIILAISLLTFKDILDFVVY